MTKPEVEQQVIAIVRTILHGREASLPLDTPIADLGMDSLATVEFVVAVENSFGAEIPEQLWTQPRLTLGHFVEHLVGTKSTRRRAVLAEKTLALPANASRAEKFRAVLNTMGLVDGLAWGIRKGIHHASALVYEQYSLLLLERDLDTLSAEADVTSPDLTINDLSEKDLEVICSLWPIHYVQKKRKHIQSRFSSGQICLGAWSGTELVGVDWITGTGIEDPETGLSLVLRDGTSFGADLYEKYPGRRIGQTLLALSLRRSKEEGYRRQVTYVRSDNIQMLSTAIQSFQFVTIGEITTRRMLRIPISSWRVGERLGNTKELML